MTEIFLGMVVGASLVQFTAPRLFLTLDAGLARKRLRQIKIVPGIPVPTRFPTPEPRRALNSEDPKAFDALVRLTRSGRTARAALNEVFGMSDQDNDDHMHLGPLLGAALVDGNFEPGALEMAASTIRDRESSAADMHAAMAQASMSARLLTLLPICAMAVMGLFSGRFRNVLSSPSMILLISVGVLLNWFGRRWMKVLISRTRSTDGESISMIIDQLCVLLRAGYPLTIACERLAPTGECGRSISTNLNNAESFELALRPLESHFGAEGRALSDVLIMAHRDGHPIAATIERLAVDNRATRRRETDIRIRQLPGKLMPPLVLCILPSFMMLSIMPMIVASLGRLTHVLPPTHS